VDCHGHHGGTIHRYHIEGCVRICNACSLELEVGVGLGAVGGGGYSYSHFDGLFEVAHASVYSAQVVQTT
jgi:hypothetical protein